MFNMFCLYSNSEPTTIASLNVQYVLFILSSTVNLQPSLPSMFNMFCLYSAQQWTYNHRFPQCSICFVYTQLNSEPTTIASLNVQYVLFILSSTVNLQPSLPSMFNMFCLYSAQQWTYNHRFPQCSICFVYTQLNSEPTTIASLNNMFCLTQLNSEPTTIASLNVQYVLFILSSTVNAKTGFGIMVDIDLKNADVRDIWRKRKKDI